MTKIRNKERRILSLLILVYLAAQGFFNPFGLVSIQLSKALFYGLSAIAVLLAYRHRVNLSFPKRPYQCLIFGIFVASIMATVYHDQSYKVSFVAVMPYLFGYLYLYVLEKYNPSEEFLEKTFQVLTLCSLVMYLVNLATFPNMVFGLTKDEYDMSRGFVRLGMPMIEIVVTYFFYSINQWLLARKRQSVFWIVLTAVMIFMSLTRQVIAVSALLGLLFVMQKASWFKKIVVIIVCVIMVYVVLPQIPMVKSMIALSEAQANSNEDDDDIRIKAWKFYTTEFQTNDITPVLGNGVPSFGNSRWGDYVEQTTTFKSLGGNACLTVDVGWAGFFWYFGGVATFGLLVLILKGIKSPKREDRQYLSYALVFIGLTAAASGPILYNSQVCSLCLILYMAYASKKNGSNHPQLQ